MTTLYKRQWTTQELLKEGFHRYERRKTVVMARELMDTEAPIRIKTEWDTLSAKAGYMICYDVADGKRRHERDDYAHWPVEPNVFMKTYRKWDEDWKPNAAEKHLNELGCKPYFKAVGVWAKQLRMPTSIRSMESVETVEIPIGGWITIGVEGEPVSMSSEEFHKRYILAPCPHDLPTQERIHSIIHALEAARQKPNNIGRDLASGVHYLRGFAAACETLDVKIGSDPDGIESQVLADHGWKTGSKVRLSQMRDKGMSDTAILKELLSIAIETTRRRYKIEDEVMQS